MTRPRPLSRRRLLRPRGHPRRTGQGGSHAGPILASPQGDVLCELLAENAALVRELARVQRRATAWRDDFAARTERLEAQLMTARARCIASTTQVAALREAVRALRGNAALAAVNESLVRRLADLRAHVRWLEADLAAARAAPPAPGP